MKTEHTPGPWMVQNHTRYQNVSSGGPGESTYKVGYDYLLIVSENGDHLTPIAELNVSTESQANADLIASAPALLAENERLREAVGSLICWVDNCWPDESESEVMTQARAALQGGGL